MKRILILAIIISLLGAGCDGTPTASSPATVPPPTNDPLPTEPITPAATMASKTLPPPTEMVTAPPHPNPATLSPVTRLPATAIVPPADRSPTPAMLTSPTAALGKLIPPGGSLTQEATPGWISYTDATYGFSFRYPEDRWLVIARPNDPHGLTLVYHEQAIVLRMRFSSAGEGVDLQLYGGAAGVFVPGGMVRFLGEEMERNALVHQGVASRIFYNDTEPIPRGDMLFSFALVSNRDGVLALLPEEVQAEADRIIESFELR